jgi:transcriptional regulator
MMWLVWIPFRRGTRVNKKHGSWDMIIGFEIEVSEVQGKFKLSQNRSQDDQQSVIQHLNDSASASDKATAALMLTI